MATFRVIKDKNFTIMSNYHLRDKSLSLKAKGLLSQMLSLPEDWDYTLSGLAYINREGKAAIRAAVNELEDAGYIKRRQTTNTGGKFSVNEYLIYEVPSEGQTDEGQTDENKKNGLNTPSSPLCGFPTTVFPTTDNRTTDKNIILNSKLNTNKLNINKSISRARERPKNKFNDFEQRTYDFEKFEKMFFNQQTADGNF